MLQTDKAHNWRVASHVMLDLSYTPPSATTNYCSMICINILRCTKESGQWSVVVNIFTFNLAQLTDTSAIKC